MPGLSLVTKGMLAPVRRQISGGGGGAGMVRRDEELPKPHIQVKNVHIENIEKESLTNDNIKVKALKIIVEQKD